MNQSKLQKYLPHLAVVLTIAYFVSAMRPQTSAAADFNYRDFGRIPVIDQGRYKPMDTVARSYLMVITHRQTYYDYDAGEKGFFAFLFGTGKRYPATKWLLDVQTTPLPTDEDMVSLFPSGKAKRPAWHHKVFRIDNDQLLEFLNLKPREGLRYSLEEIIEGGKIDAFFKEVTRVRGIDPKQHKLFDAKVNELSQHIHLYIQLSSHSVPFVIPSPNGDDQWKAFRDAAEQFGSLGGNLPEGVDAETFATYRELLVAYDQGDKAAFNSTLARYLGRLQAEGKLTKMNTEIFFNEFAPFYRSLLVYAVLALFAGLSWMNLTWSEPIRKAAYAAMAVTFVFHLSGLVLRMYLQDRLFVFVTNLYSSAVFIGLGCVFVCLIAEWFYRNGIAIVVGAVTGFCTLIIAHMLSLDGDTMIMMQAVLDTNFWLATHVTCVTLGYTMAFVAGAMGIAYISLGIFTNKLRKDGSAELTRMTYGVLCAGMLLSFVGTVLGGLWADYSWGRFWGWDPKENGALLIVIWIALILHARWGGMVKHRGIAVLSVLGIIVTSWSWFGTNFLGVGLHAYGGAKADAMLALILFDLVIASIAGLGAFLPLEMWQSFCPPAPVSNVEPPKLNLSAKSAAKMA
jgi:ABC-type transport system involved in cytochrome c biogenesis permease subunit